ncbi:MAG: putative lipid II flippase FtsW [Candidatus Riflebacteria bacterium]|nr:putative lipid II flippase FtsW [Candidatus Riflebacteria bacterium]
MKIVPASVDQKLLFMLMALLGIGLVLVFSSSSVTSLEQFQDKFYLVKRQGRFMLLGVVLMVTLMSMDYHRLRALAVPGLLMSVGMLLLVFIPGVGKTVNGATRWVLLGPLSFQPAEIAKLAVILYLADRLAKNYKKRDSFRDYLLPNLLLLTSFTLLIVKQKSLSLATLVMGIGFSMILVAHANLGHILSICLIGLISVSGLIYAEPYRVRRLVAFADPWSDPGGAGYQIIQSLMAMGSGGVAGVGIGQGLQKLKHLPFVSTDFIFAVVGEEMGMIGGIVVIILFIGVLYRGVRITLRAPDLFGMFLAFGITVAIGLQALLNLMVVMGLMPTTGIPLPFISAGGSSLVCMMASAGVLLSISRAAETDSLSRLSRRWSQA